MRGKNEKIILSLLAPSLLLLIYLIYLPGLKSPFYLDDSWVIVENSQVHFSPSTMGEKIESIFSRPIIGGRPLAFLTFGLNYLHAGLNPFFFRLVNVTAHAVSAILVYILAGLVLGSPGGKAPDPLRKYVPWCAAALFSAHPVATQSVTYIVQRMNTMMTLFFLAGAVFFMKGWGGHGKVRRKAFYLLGALSVGISAGFKENVVTLPFVLLFAYLLLWKEYPDIGALVKDRKTAVLFAGMIFLGLLLAGFVTYRYYPSYADYDFTLRERLYTQFRVVPYYLTLFAFPHPGRLRLLYDFPVSKTLFSPPGTILGLVVLVVISGSVVYFFKRDRIVSFCIFWFLFNLLPESSVLPLDLVFEHRLYLPSVGLCLLAPYLTFKIGDRFGEGRKGGREGGGLGLKLTIGAVALIVAVFSLWTRERNMVWANPSEFWADNIRKSPGNPKGYLGLSKLLMDGGRCGDALGYMSRGLVKNPGRDTEISMKNNMGVCYARLKRYGESEDIFHEILEKYGYVPRTAYNLGVVSFLKGDPEGAVEWFGELDSRGYRSADLYYYLGRISHGEGDRVSALASYRKAVEISPHDVESWKGIALLEYEAGNLPGALPAFAVLEEAGLLARDPDLIFKAGAVNLGERRLVEAERYFEKFLELVPGNPNGYYNLACVYSIKGDKKRAFQYLEESLVKGFRSEIIHTDGDLENIRNTDRFRRLLNKYY